MDNENKQESNNPEDVAAYHFKAFLPRYIALVDKLSLKSLKRLTKSLVAYPLEDMKHKHRKGDEEEALKLGESLVQSKFIMFMTNLNKLAEEQQSKIENKETTSEQLSSETKVQKGEEVNG